LRTYWGRSSPLPTHPTPPINKHSIGSSALQRVRKGRHYPSPPRSTARARRLQPTHGAHSHRRAAAGGTECAPRCPAPWHQRQRRTWRLPCHHPLPWVTRTWTSAGHVHPALHTAPAIRSDGSVAHPHHSSSATCMETTDWSCARPSERWVTGKGSKHGGYRASTHPSGRMVHGQR
jgi:hypothetical protein